MFLCWKPLLKWGWLWVCVLRWLVATEDFPDSDSSTLVLLRVHGSCVPSPAIEQMALAPVLGTHSRHPFLVQKD